MNESKSFSNHCMILELNTILKLIQRIFKNSKILMREIYTQFNRNFSQEELKLYKSTSLLTMIIFILSIFYHIYNDTFGLGKSKMGILNNEGFYFNSYINTYSTITNTKKRNLESESTLMLNDLNNSSLKNSNKVNQTIVNSNPELSKDDFLERLNTFEFFNNLSLSKFEGNWKSSSLKGNFEKTEGRAYMNFFLSSNMIFDTYQNSNQIPMQIIVNDGFYQDNSIYYRLNLTIPSNLNYNVNKDIILISNSSINIKIWNIFEPIGELNCNGIFTLMFKNEETELEKKMTHSKTIKYSKISVNIQGVDSDKYNNDKDCLSLIDFDFKVTQEENISYRIANYSTFSIFICLNLLIKTIELFNEIINNNQIGENVDLVTICVNIIFNSIISIFHFFLAINSDRNQVFKFLFVFFFYFILFSVFELRVFFFAIKSRYVDLQFNDIELFKKKVCFIYSIFYIYLVTTLIFLNYIYLNPFLFYMMYMTTWIFQIIYSAYKGTKPAQSIYYIILASLSKLYFTVSFLFLFRIILSDVQQTSET